MRTEYPNQDQRYAICRTQLERRSSKAARDRTLAVWLRQLARFERDYTLRYARLLSVYGQRVAQAYQAEGKNAATSALSGLQQEVHALVTRNTVQAAQTFGGQVLGTLSKYTLQPMNRKNAESFFQQRIQDYIAANALKKAKLIDDTTKASLADALATAEREEWSPYQTAQFITQRIGGQTANARGATIARTETHAAASFASDAAASATGLRLEREWMATEDSRTRHSHREMDGQRAPMDEPFRLPGGGSIQRPGDPDAPASETINCRCALAYHEVR